MNRSIKLERTSMTTYQREIPQADETNDHVIPALDQFRHRLRHFAAIHG